MAFAYGDHDLRFLDSFLDEAYEIAGSQAPPSLRMAFERGYVLYCPSCRSFSVVPYSSQPMTEEGDRDAAVRRAGEIFAESVLESCRDQALRLQIAEVMES